MEWLLLVIVVALVNGLVAELLDWMPWMARRVITFAARWLPASSQERWETEWLAEMEAVPGRGVSKVLFSLSVLRGAPATRIALDPSAPRLRQLAGKRIFDVAFASFALVFLAPLLLVVSVLIRASVGPGPVLIRSERVGGDGRRFNLLRFRTMKSDGTRGKVGRFLYDKELDGLPQLINVLRGEMSVVGPLPLSTYEASALSDLFRPGPMPGVKAGILSWTMFTSDDDESRRRDLAYHQGWSIGRALEALFMALLSGMRLRTPRARYAALASLTLAILMVVFAKAL
jgi:lipopolysaccharide/colanic/teichoic acid biosynthesis glycosyltransferase